MKLCIVCGTEISDYDILVARGLNPPKYCEVCRHQIRNYRPKISVKHELCNAWVAKPTSRLLSQLKYEGIAEKGKDPQRKEVFKYSLGGRDFGPWGGASYDEKYMVYAIEKLEANQPYLIRLMKKINIETNKSWLYLVFEADNSETDLTMDIQFTRIWKTTLKGYGRQFDEEHPVEVPYEVVLQGGSTARSGRYGNNWVLYITNEEVEDI